MAYTKYSLTPANNTAAPPDGAPEGMLPSAVNDTMRDMMSQIRDAGDGIRDGTYTMTTPKITGGTITGATFTGNTFSSPVISGGTINNATIGATTATTGKFTTLEATGVATFSAGAVGTPAITTTGDTNTGIFFPAADTIAFAEGGVESMRIDSSGNVGIGTSSPTARLGIPIPEFSASSTSGMVRFQNPNVAADSCIQSYYVSSDGSDINIGANSFVNTAGSTVRFSNSYASSAINIRRDGVLAFRTNTSAGDATERMRIDSSGKVGIGTSSPLAKLDVIGSGAANSIMTETSAFFGQSNGLYIGSDGTDVLLGVGNSGTKISLLSRSAGVYSKALTIDSGGFLSCPGVYNSTTANAANVYVFAAGDIARSTSSRKYKTDIVDYSKGLNEVMLLRPVSYKGINDGDKQFAGLIAEEVADKGLVEFVQYAEDGTPDGLAYPHMIALLTKAIQEQQALIENLTTRLNALEGN